MWAIDLLERRNRFILLLGQIIVLVICLYIIIFIYHADILPDVQAKQTFKHSECYLISKRLNVSGGFFTPYRAEFLISYEAKGTRYNTWVSGNGLDFSFNQSRVDEESILSQFVVGNHYSCWYNPVKPEKAMLLLRHDWVSTAPLIIPAVIGMIVFYFLIKNIFYVIRLSTFKNPFTFKKRKKSKKSKKSK